MYIQILDTEWQAIGGYGKPKHCTREKTWNLLFFLIATINKIVKNLNLRKIMFSSKKHKYYTIKINVILINLGMNAENTQELLNKYISR